MRLSKKRTIEQATRELLSILKNREATSFLDSIPTKDLIGTPAFHGSRTLTPRQVGRLLLASGKVNSVLNDFGMFYQKRWWLRGENEPERHIRR